MRDLSGNFVGEESSEKEIIVNLCQEFYRLGWMTGSRIQILTRLVQDNSQKSKKLLTDLLATPTLSLL